MEHSRRVDRRCGRTAGRRLPRVEPPRRQLQRPGPQTAPTLRASAAPPHAAGPARLDPVPHVVLPGRLGVLPFPTRPRGAAGGRLRSRHRLDARRWSPELRRAVPARRGDGRNPSLRSCLPPLARQRQPVRPRAARRPRALPGGRAAALFVPISLRTRHDRLDRLAFRQPRGRRPNPPRPRGRLRRRRGAADLQEEPPRRRRDRSRGGPRPAAHAPPATRSSSFLHTDTTSASTDLPGSTSPSEA